MVVDFEIQKYDVELTDLDLDGDVDILFATENGIEWFENVDATFSNRREIAREILGIRGLVATDLDGDGDSDVVAASRDQDKIVWFRNRGGGLFDDELVVSMDVMTPTSVFSADMDGDGDKDLLSTSRGDDKVAWYENIDGLGTFSDQKIISTVADGAESVTAADVDGDGDQDVLSVSFSDNVTAWYENLDGKGDFGHQRRISRLVRDPRDIATGDLDGDGDLDLIVASNRQGSNNVWRFKNVDGVTRFDRGTRISGSGESVRNLSIVDLDGDGDNDVLGVSSIYDTLLWYENTDGMGNFGDATFLSYDLFGGYAIATDDIDDDGDVDIAVASRDDGKIAWFENDGDARFRQNVLEAGSFRAEWSDAVDIDNDGDLDILAAFGENLAAWSENLDGQGKAFSAFQTIATENGQIPFYVRHADVDGDGDPDVLTSGAELKWYENEAGLFGEGNIIGPRVDTWNALRIVDFDVDGDVDLLVSQNSGRRGKSNVVWWENVDGKGSFQENAIIIGDLFSPDILATDIDGDGFADVVVASWTEETAWFKNFEGNGFSTAREIPNAPFEAGGIFSGDADGDGDNDLLISLAWYENTNGSGEFARVDWFKPSNPADTPVGIVDFDGDGDLDVLSQMQGHEDLSVAWHENTNGLGAFDERRLVANNIRGRSWATADIDANGQMDVLIVSQQPSEWIVWYESRFVGDSNGDGVFDSSDFVAVFQAGEYEDGIEGNSTFSEGDWDGDGEFSSSDLVHAFQTGLYQFATPGPQ